MLLIVAGLVGSTSAAITALFYLTVLQQPPSPVVMGLVGVLAGLLAGWRWRAAEPAGPE